MLTRPFTILGTAGFNYREKMGKKKLNQEMLFGLRS